MAVVEPLDTVPSGRELVALGQLSEAFGELDMLEAVSVIAIWFAGALHNLEEELTVPYWLGALQIAVTEALHVHDEEHDEEHDDSGEVH
jgi:hypothetical protein